MDARENASLPDMWTAVRQSGAVQVTRSKTAALTAEVMPAGAAGAVPAGKRARHSTGQVPPLPSGAPPEAGVMKEVFSIVRAPPAAKRPRRSDAQRGSGEAPVPATAPLLAPRSTPPASGGERLHGGHVAAKATNTSPLAVPGQPSGGAGPKGADPRVHQCVLCARLSASPHI